MRTVVEQAGLGETWAALLHPKIQALVVPKLPGIDCNNCHMVQARGFAPYARCCNIYPEFPNFLLGEILVKGQADGSSERIEQWIDEGRAGPAFAHKPPLMHKKHDDSRYSSIAEVPPCPLLNQEGGCTVYHQRPVPCIEFNCVYPPYPEIIAFWHAFHSLLGVHSLVSSSYLMEVLGFNLEQNRRLWLQETPEAIWEEGLSMRDDFLTQLWQNKPKQEFYRACYEYVQAHQATIRDEIETFHRKDLVRRMKQENISTPEREMGLTQLPLEPNLTEPTVDLWELFASGNHLKPEDNWLSLTEFEGMVLWLYHSMIGRYGALSQLHSAPLP